MLAQQIAADAGGTPFDTSSARPPVACARLLLKSTAAGDDGCSIGEVADGTADGEAAAVVGVSAAATSGGVRNSPRTAVEAVLGVTATGWLSGVRRKLTGSWSET